MKRLRPSFVRLSVFTALVLASGVGGGWKWERLIG
jgi:hypothetical protein